MAKPVYFLHDKNLVQDFSTPCLNKFQTFGRFGTDLNARKNTDVLNVMDNVEELYNHDRDFETETEE